LLVAVAVVTAPVEQEVLHIILHNLLAVFK
jgi:hypothetical protein